MGDDRRSEYTRSTPTLYLLGAGVSFPKHLTAESIEVLSICEKILTNLPEAICENFPDYLRPKIQSVWGLYQENRNRIDNCKDVTHAIIKAAITASPVAWVTPGHPLVFDSVSTNLLEASHNLRWNIEVVTTIVGIDTVLADVGYDPANGLVVCEATVAAKQNIGLIPTVATLLSQPGAFGSAITHYTAGWRPDLTSLQSYLAGFFGLEHRCAFVRSCSNPDGSSQIYWASIRDMTSVPLSALAGSTLFVPPVMSTLREGGILSGSLSSAAAG